MLTFAPKRNKLRPASSGLSRSTRVAPELHHRASLSLHSQSTIGNQAVQRLLQQVRFDEIEARSSIKEITRFTHDFSQISVHPRSPVNIQAELAVNTPGDIYEQEADPSPNK
jgi:hypothetical protein